MTVELAPLFGWAAFGMFSGWVYFRLLLEWVERITANGVASLEALLFGAARVGTLFAAFAALILLGAGIADTIAWLIGLIATRMFMTANLSRDERER